jgi:hypothetical protein
MAGPTFRSEDDEAQFCLGVLRDGTPDAKMNARERLAAIFMRRGLFAEAVEAYELNVRAGARSADLFEQLGAAYRQIGEHAAAAAALAEARRMRAVAVPAPEQRPATPAQALPATGDALPPPPPPSAAGQPGSSGSVTVSPPAPAPGTAPAERADEHPTPSPAERADEHATPGGAPPVVSFPTPPPSPVPAPPRHAPAVDADDDEADGPYSPSALRADRDRDRWLGLGPVQSAPPPLAPPYESTARLPSQWGVIDTGLLSDEEDGTAARSGPSAPRPLVILGAVIFLMLVPIVLLAFVVVNPVALYLEGRSAGPTLDASADAASPPEPLKVAAGTTTSWYIQDGRSVSGLWATTGLDLTFDEEVAGVGRTVEVTAAHPQTWGETITIVERRGQGRSNQATLLTASFDSPATLPPAGTVLTGRIAGPVTAPRLSESNQFATTTETLNVPVRLLVVPGWELWADRFTHACLLFFRDDRWLLVTIVALLIWCVLAGSAALLFRIGRR